MTRPRTHAAVATLPWLRLSLLLAVWGGLFTYAGRPLLVTARVAGLEPVHAWTSLAVLAFLPMLPLLARRQGSALQRNLLHRVGYFTLALFSMLLVAVIATDLVRLALSVARFLVKTVPVPSLNVALLSLGALGGAALLTALGAAQAHCPATRRVAIRIDDLPAELDGYTIVQWSDVHIGPSIRRRFMQTLVDRTNALEPDAVAITGDFIDANFDEIGEQLQPVRELRTRDGVFYVTGNHEYYWNAPAWLHSLEALGIRHLQNAHDVVRRGDAQLVIAGVTDPVGRGAHRQDVPAALHGAPADAIKVLLSHRPQMAAAADRHGVHLQLSGHTHGGQFFPFNLVIRWFQPIVAGLHRVGSTWLYVSRGTGFWGPPSRLGVGAELTVIELRR
jgi:predicted MPP superfamily phosphohydrolase